MSWIVRPLGAAPAVAAASSTARNVVRCIVAIYHSRVPSVVDPILQYLRAPRVVLSGTPVSALTMVTAITIVLAARVVAASVGRSIERVLAARELDKGMRFAANKITRYVIMTIGVFSAMMGAGAVLLVGIGFGLLLLLEPPVREGDFIDVGGVLGTVEDIGLGATHAIPPPSARA